MHFKIGTRSSKLAVWQAEFIAETLQNAHHTTELVLFETAGDKQLEVSIAKIGSKGVFTQELEQALFDGTIDVAVHSAKDLQSTLPEGLSIIAFTKREPAHDVVVSYNPDFRLATAPQGTIVGSSSTRRRAMLYKYFPQLNLVEMRGNLQTRFKKLAEGQAEAMLLAYAGVKRMGLEAQIVEHLPIDIFTPPAGQASIALEIAASLDSEKKSILQHTCNDEQAWLPVSIERAFLKAMDGGCSIPVFAHGYFEDSLMVFQAGIASLDGTTIIEEKVKFTLQEYSTANAVEALANKIFKNGGEAILQQIKQQQSK